MRTFLLFLLTVLCIGILVSGHLHWHSKIAAAGVEGKLEVEKIQAEEQKEREALLESLNPQNNKSQSIIDFLRYRSLVQDRVVISAVGSDGTAGIGASHQSRTWPKLLERHLRSEVSELSELQLKIHGFEGYSSSDLINSGKIDNVIAGQPDLIIFENPTLANFSQSISLEQSEMEMEELVNSIKNSLPNVKIIFLMSHPIVNMENKNNIELHYNDYVLASIEKAKRNNWTYINSNEEILLKIKEENSVLADIMSTNNLHLNDKGYSLWYEVIRDFLKG